MEYLIIISLEALLVLIGYRTSVWLIKLFKNTETNTEQIEELGDLHCFECEIEMPVKKANGRYYCSNCGLYH
jgi:hypothetical protein